MKNITYINAGAGSGKTYTLTHKLTGLIKNGVAPEQVILTTFTTKAADEFKVEAKKVLYEAGLYDEAVRLDHAMIGTVHSVCQQMISKYWFLLGLSPNRGVMSDDDTTFYVSQSLAELPTDDELKLLHECCRRFDFRRKEGFYVKGLDYDFWQKDLKVIIGLATNYEMENLDSSCEASLKFIKQLVRKGARVSISDEELGMMLKEARQHVEQSKQLSAKQKYYKAFDEIERNSMGRSFAWYDKVLKDINAKYGPTCAAVSERLAWLWNSEDVYEEEEKYIRLLFDLAKRWKEKFAMFKKEKNLLDYNDMEKYMLKLIKHDAVASEISKSYRYLFVDEFQDSSPIQVKIFDRLSELMEHSYWVGDYKQAIYGFRGADTELTKAVVDIISSGQEGCDTFTLDTSYRSLPDIVEANNRVFKQTFSGVLPERNIVLQKHKKNEKGIESLRYIRTNKDVLVADHIVKLLQEGIAAKDIGVIARRNDELDKLAEDLRARDVEVNREDISVVGTATYVLITSLLRIVSSDNDTLAKATIAMMIEQDFSTKKLIEERLLNKSDEEQTDKDLLADTPLLRQLLKIKPGLQQQSVAAMVESMIVELNLYDEVKRIEAEGAAGVCSLQTIIRTARQYEEHCVQMNSPATIEGFLSYIEVLDPKGASSPDGVQLHTYHSCKGLQWKVVVLLSLEKIALDEQKVMQQEMYGVHVERETKPGKDELYPETLIRVTPWVYGALKNVPKTVSGLLLKSPELREAEERYLSEMNRLLYVGMTRPVETLILNLDISKKKPLSWFETEGLTNLVTAAPTGDEDILGIGMEFADYTVASDEFEPVCYDESNDEETGCRRLKIDEPTFEVRAPRYVSPSKQEGIACVVQHYNFGGRIPLGKEPEDMAVVGDCIHQIFATIEEVRPAYTIERKEVIENYRLTKVLVSTKEIDEAWKHLVDFMTEKYGTPIKTYHERPFMLDLDGQRYTGSIDLVWQTANGDVLIDYKTCPMGEKAILDINSDHYVGRYGGQLDIYAKALEMAGEKVVARYIYYPVSGLMVELAND